MTTTRRVAALAVAGLLFAACGGGDESSGSTDPLTTETSSPAGSGGATPATGAATDPTTAPPATNAPATSDATGATDAPSAPPGESPSQMPAACEDLVAEMLATLEPLVENIDWDQATASDLSALDAIYGDSTDLDERLEAAGCDEFVALETAESIDEMIAFAGEVAPGTVGLFELLRDVMGSSDLPDTCDATIAAVEEMMTTTDRSRNMEIDDQTLFFDLLLHIDEICPADQATEFNGREDLQTFLFGD